jgi:outer membrane lipoprotein SlyB
MLSRHWRYLNLVLVLVVSVLVLAGCPASMSGAAYSRDQARGTQDVQYGTVETVRQVLIEGTGTGIGALGGAATGGVLGSGIGGGRGQSLAIIGGALLGGVAGAAAEEGMTRQAGLEIAVRLDSGRIIAVTQAADQMFSPGDRVRVLTGRDGTTRVSY